MREGYFLVRAPVWGRPQEFSKGFAARQQSLRLRPTRGLRGPVGWWIAKFRVFLGQSALVRFSELFEYNMYHHRNSLACGFLL